jgi:hypothetical protein
MMLPLGYESCLQKEPDCFDRGFSSDSPNGQVLMGTRGRHRRYH